MRRTVLCEATASWQVARPAEDLAREIDEVRDAAGEVWRGEDPVARLDRFAHHARSRVAFEEARRRLVSLRRLVLLGAAILVALAGAAAVAAVLPSSRTQPVNVFWLLGGFLATQTMLLVGWIVAFLVLPGVPPSIAAPLIRLLRWLGSRTAGAATSHRDAPGDATAIRLLGERWSRVQARGRLGRWTLGTVSNLLWTVFNLAGLLTAVALLSARQYQFAWESTILTPSAYVLVTDAVASLPRAMGFPAPDSTLIDASRFDPVSPQEFLPQGDAERAAWSGLLVGSIVAYALLPRAVLFLVSLAGMLVVGGRARPDSADPAVARLLAALAPTSRREGAIPPDAPLPVVGAARATIPRPAGPPALAGLELDPPASGWPPALGLAIDDLGLVASREERRACATRLAAAGTSPDPLVLVADLVVVPDRGMRAAIEEIASAAGGPIVVVLTGGSRLRARESTAGAAHRLDDWRRLLADPSLRSPGIVEVDLDHLTAESRTILRRAIEGATAATGSPLVELSAAFSLIRGAALEWRDGERAVRTPMPLEEAELHRAIARHFESRSPGRLPFTAPSLDDAAGSLRRAAARVEAMLPPALRLRPRWLAAGAVAGALGCVAAATMVAPIAISALPAWSAIGAALGGVLSSLRRGDASGSPALEQESTVDLAPATSAAAVQAVLLAYQGRGERDVAEALAAAFDPDGPPPLRDPAAVARFLDSIMTRLSARGGERRS